MQNDSPKTLTPKQAAFVEEYLVDLNATQAAIRAGYSAKTAGQIGEQNLKKLEIKTAIQERMESRSKRVQRTADDVLRDLQLVKEDAMKVGEDGMADRPAALRALELEGKHFAMWTDKVETTTHAFEELTEEQLDAKLADLRRKAGGSVTA